MTIPYVSGTVSVTAGNAVVTGVGTGWQTGLVTGGMFGLDSANGNPVPILSIDNDTQLTLAKPWRGTTEAGQAYWILRDTAYGQQSVANANALATIINELRNPAVSALAAISAQLGAGKVPRGQSATVMEMFTVTDAAKALLNLAGNAAADKLPYFNGDSGSALATLTASGRALIGQVGAADKLPFYTSGTAVGAIDFPQGSRDRISGGLGTAANKNTGSSGDAVPLCNGTNTWTGTQTIRTVICSDSLALRMSAPSEAYTENLGIYRTVTKRRGNGNWFWRLSDDGLSGGPNLANVMELRDSGHFFVPGIYAQVTAAAANVNVDANGTLLRSTSSGKYKKDIEELDSSHRDLIFDLRPVWYRSTCGNDDGLWSWYGLIAEEVAEIDPRLVHWKTKTSRLHVTKKLEDVEVAYLDEDGQPAVRIEQQEIVDKVETIEEQLPTPIAEGVMYERLVPHLIAVVQMQRGQIAALSERVAALETGVMPGN